MLATEILLSSIHTSTLTESASEIQVCMYFYSHFLKHLFQCLESVLVTITTTYDVGSGATGELPWLLHAVVNDLLHTSEVADVYDNGPLFTSSIGGRFIRFVGNGGTICYLPDHQK